LESLFDSAFLKRLEALRFAARRVPRLGRAAEQPSAGRGGGIEFADYRDYAPGESLKRVDWNIYQRLGRLYLRLFVEDLDLPIRIVLDASDSVFHNDERAAAGLQAAGALAWVGAAGHDRVRIHPFGSTPLSPFGPASSKEACIGLLCRLEEQKPSGRTAIADALRRLSGSGGRRGLLVIVSDFFFTEGFEPALAAIAGLPDRLLLLRLVHPEDGAPPLRGEVRLRDCETGEVREVTVTPAVLEGYRTAYDAFGERLRRFARSRGAGLLEIDATGDVVSQLEKLFRGGRLPV
jgi:uncharacterized protein (DUF58 family)